MKDYFRAIPRTDVARPSGSMAIAGGWCWFSDVEHLRRGKPAEIVPISEVPKDVITKITAPRAAITGLGMSAPRVMGILNVTPDSFSDGGRFVSPEIAMEHATTMVREGADILDIGGESTRPGADFVPINEEITRTAPVIAALREQMSVPISIDTRKSAVAEAALEAGANLLNDVAAMTFDPDMAQVAAGANAPMCLMHAQGDPATMQANPSYDDVLLDVYDFLEERLASACENGISPSSVILDPGIGFGKTLEHNLALLRRISLFHSLGCPILLGASRKRFIGTISGAEAADQRVSGSVAVGLGALAQGVQILRVHDIAQTKQAISLFWRLLED